MPATSAEGTGGPRGRVHTVTRAPVERGAPAPPADLLPRLAATRTVPRDALLRRLTGLAPEVALVVLSAPVGYGKTTLAYQWAELGGSPVAWVSVGHGHGDPSELLRELAAAVLRLYPGDAAAVTLLGGPADVSDAVDTFAAAIDAMGAVGAPALLVLDDLHLARSRASLDLVVRLAAQLPRGSRIVATADHDPRLPLHRLSAEQCVELGPDDLAFSAAEAAALLETSGVLLPGTAVEELVAHVEGWPAGVQLAAGLLGRRSDPAAAVRALTGDDQPFADYFRDEVLAGHSAETVRFLLRTAVLDRLNGPLCDAALDSTGSAEWLAELEALGMPIVRLESGGSEFRYRRLFAEMLRGELHRREPGEHLRVLRRAAQWYEEHDLLEQAIGCAFAGEDRRNAARLLVAGVQGLTTAGRLERLLRWVDDLGEQMLLEYPPLAAAATWVFALTGDASRARYALSVAESATFEGPLPDGSSSLTSAVARARAGLAPNGVAAMLDDAELAVQLEPPGSRWHTMGALLLGLAQRLTGVTDEAARWFEQAARFGRPEQRPGACLALAELALLAADLDDWTTAAACTAEARQLLDGGALGRSAPTVAVCTAEGRVAVHAGDLDAARADGRRALDALRVAAPVAIPWLAAHLALQLGRVLLSLGELAEAEALAAEARRHLTVLPTAGLLTEWADRLVEDVRRARDRTEAQGTAALTTAERRVLSLLPTYLSMAQIAAELVVSRNTVKTEVAAIYRKLGVSNRADAVRRALDTGLLSPADVGRTS